MEKLPLHEILKYNSPLTYVLKTIHRRGDHRSCGDILEALISIHKLSVSKYDRIITIILVAVFCHLGASHQALPGTLQFCNI